MRELADVRGEQVASIGSQDMNDEVWVRLAARTNELLAQRDVDGVVITHGTDTLEETSYFLQLVVRSDKPVVMTGSMRPATAMSADGPLNMYNAAAVAADPASRGRGVLVVLERRHPLGARRREDPHHRRRDLPLERGRADRGHALRDTGVLPEAREDPHRPRASSASRPAQTLPRVDVIHAHAGMSPDLIDAAVANGAKGLVVAGVGDGNMTAPGARRAEARDRQGRGGGAREPRRRRLRPPERRGERRQLGTVAGMDLNPGKSARAAEARAHQDRRPERHPALLRPLLSPRRSIMAKNDLRIDLRPRRRAAAHRGRPTPTPSIATSTCGAPARSLADRAPRRAVSRHAGRSSNRSTSRRPQPVGRHDPGLEARPGARRERADQLRARRRARRRA